MVNIIAYLLILIGLLYFFTGIISVIRRLYALRIGTYKPIFKYLPLLSLFSSSRIIITSDNPSYYPKLPGTVINFTKEDTQKLKEKYTSQSWTDAFTSVLKGGSAKASVHPNVFKAMMIMESFSNLVIAGIGAWIAFIGFNQL